MNKVWNSFNRSLRISTGSNDIVVYLDINLNVRKLTNEEKQHVFFFKDKTEKKFVIKIIDKNMIFMRLPNVKYSRNMKIKQTLSNFEHEK